MNQKQHFVIVGGGQAGGCAARALREYGFEGKITLIADEAYPPYERPPLSKDVLLGKEQFQSTYVNEDDWYANQSVELKLETRVEKIDRGRKVVETVAGESIGYDKLLLATGGRVRQLPIPGSELNGVNYLRGIDDLLSLKEQLGSCRRLVGIGAGFISLEIAAVARTLGLEVTLLERLPTILDRVLENDVADHIEALHRAKGVEFRTDVSVEEIVGEFNKVTGVRLGCGEVIPADVIVIGIGIVPNSELAEAAGLEVNNGIIVNEYGETSVPDIYACGDITNHFNPLYNGSRRLENWQNAQNQPATVAQAMLGNRVPYQDVPWFWSDQYDMNLQMAGISEGYDQSVVRANEDADTFSKVYLKDNQIIGAVAINAGKEIMAARKLIAKRVCMDVDKLADPSLDLRKAVNK